MSLILLDELQHVEAGVGDDVVTVPDDAVERLLGRGQELHQPDLHTALGAHRPVQGDDLPLLGDDGDNLVVVPGVKLDRGDVLED